MIEQLVRFYIADYLKTPKDIAAYLEACVESDPGDGSLIQNALTTSFKQTLYERSGHDPELAQALLDEAATLFTNGERELAHITLQALVQAFITAD